MHVEQYESRFNLVVVSKACRILTAIVYKCQLDDFPYKNVVTRYMSVQHYTIIVLLRKILHQSEFSIQVNIKLL